MSITSETYVPLLRWRMGEYQALEKLGDAQKARVVPLLEVLPPDYDFEQRRPKKDVDDQLSSFADKLHKKWGTRPALVDGIQLPLETRMKDGRHFMAYLFDDARGRGLPLIPVTGLDRDDAYQEAVRSIINVDSAGAALRCSLEEALDPDFDPNVRRLLQRIGIDERSLDLLLDLKTPTFDPEDGLVATIVAALQTANIFTAARSVTILATSFPQALNQLKHPIQSIPRREWMLYKALVRALPADTRRPAYGDYAVAAITFAQGDMRFMRGSPNIRYATNNAWLVAKAKREKGGSNQAYPRLCSSILASPDYLGESFSAGSSYVAGCHAGTQKRGNPTVWKWVATNQHITKVVDDLSNLPDA